MTAKNPLSPYFAWNDERKEKLKELRASGLSASQIVMKFHELYHTAPTRNAILGKCHRMDISSPRRRRDGAGRPRRVRKPKKILTNGLNTLRESLEAEIEGGEARDLPPDQSPNAVTFAELAEHHCRWPLPDKRYCGDKHIDGFSYCPRHCRVAYRSEGRR